jgi:hypothetical protein
MLPECRHFLGTEQLSESSTSSKQSEEQPRNLGHRGVGAVHDAVHHGYHSARLPSTHQQGNLSDTNAGSNCFAAVLSASPPYLLWGQYYFMCIPCIVIVYYLLVPTNAHIYIKIFN